MGGVESAPASAIAVERKDAVGGAVDEVGFPDQVGGGVVFGVYLATIKQVSRRRQRTGCKNEAPVLCIELAHPPQPIRSFMCLILFGLNAHPEVPLIVAANRDEFYERPTAPAHVWPEAPHVLAGRDEKAGGTWMGVTRSGHWAAITNYRDPEAEHKDEAPSRGDLVADYLKQQPDPQAYIEQVASSSERYNGFNLLVGTPAGAYYFSNRDGSIRTLRAGIYGLSNHLLDSAWPKVERGKKTLARHLERDAPAPGPLLDLLYDTEQPVDEKLPDTGIGLAGERLLSPMFIESETYGTRASTVLMIRRDATITFAERTFNRGTPEATRRFSFEQSDDPTAPIPSADG